MEVELTFAHIIEERDGFSIFSRLNGNCIHCQSKFRDEPGTVHVISMHCSNDSPLPLSDSFDHSMRLHYGETGMYLVGAAGVQKLSGFARPRAQWDRVILNRLIADGRGVRE